MRAQIAWIHGHDSIVLGALGCGAFKNPAEHVAVLFREVRHALGGQHPHTRTRTLSHVSYTVRVQVINVEFRHKFRVVAFAIFEDGNSVSEINPRGNGRPFADAFAVPLMSTEEFSDALPAEAAAAVSDTK